MNLERHFVNRIRQQAKLVKMQPHFAIKLMAYGKIFHGTHFNNGHHLPLEFHVLRSVILPSPLTQEEYLQC